MKRASRIISALATILMLAGIVAVHVLEKRGQNLVTCQKVVVEFPDSVGFLSAADIKALVRRNYGNCLGQKTDSVSLCRIEDLIKSNGAVKSCEAWTLDDGTLGITVRERRPVALFRRTGGRSWYVDAEGNSIPAGRTIKTRVPAVDGNIPMDDINWNRGMLSLLGTLSSSSWKEKISRITVEGTGNVTIIPKEGKVRYIFGNFSDIDGKLAKMEDFDRYIRPVHDGYSTVNVMYAGQIICK